MSQHRVDEIRSYSNAGNDPVEFPVGITGANGGPLNAPGGIAGLAAAGGSAGKNYLASQFDNEGGVTVNTLAGATADRDTTQTALIGAWRQSVDSLLVDETTDPIRGDQSYKIDGAVGGIADFIESPMFQLDEIDLNSPNQIALDTKAIDSFLASGDMVLSAIRYDSAGVFQEEITVRANGTNGDIPRGSYRDFAADFNTSGTDTDYYSFRITRATAGAGLVFDSVRMGPVVVLSAGDIFYEIDPTTIIDVAVPPAGVTLNTSSLRCYRHNSRLILDGPATFVGSGASTSVANIAFVLAKAYVGNITRGVTAIVPEGSGGSFNVGPLYNEFPAVIYNPGPGSTFLGLLQANGVAGRPPMGYDNVVNRDLSIYFSNVTIEIAEWQNSGETRIGAGAEIEYAWNASGETTAGAVSSDPADFRNTPEGALIGSINSLTANSTTVFEVEFQTPIRETDVVLLQLKSPGRTWQLPGNSFICNLDRQATDIYGVGFDSDLNSRKALVQFGNSGRIQSNASYSDFGGSWSDVAAWNWRLIKIPAALLKGITQAQDGNLGLVRRETGTWSPTLTSQGTAPSLTYAANNTGSYERIGNTVKISGRIELATLTNSPTGNIVVQGFPFQPVDKVDIDLLPINRMFNFASGIPSVTGFHLSPFNGNIYYNEALNTGNNLLQATELTATTTFVFSGTYQIQE